MVVEYLQKLEKDIDIDQPLYYRLNTREAILSFFGVPKIHKEGVPLRPIPGKKTWLPRTYPST